jgi:hypothetical protein
MLGKLLKYDLKSVWRIWWIAAVSAFGASFVGAFGLRIFLTGLFNTPTGEMSREITLVMILALIVCGLAVLAIVASVVLMEILVYWRFYTHFFSDEGYLTFTLPVRRKTLLLSKTLNAIIWTVAHMLLLCVCLLIFFVFAPPAPEDGGFFNPVALKWVGKAISEIWEFVGAKWILLYSLAALLSMAGMTVFSISMVHFCITLGAVIAKKAKLLAAIGMYYLITTVISFVFQAVTTVIGIFMTERFVLMIFEMTENEIAWVLWLIMMLVATVMAALASTMYFLTLGNLERKLNLA